MAAWHTWRGERLLPSRRDFDLSMIKRLLPRMVLLDVRSADEVRFRLVGTGITRALGVELTGRNYLDLGDPNDRGERASFLFAELNQPCGAVMLYPIYYASGRMAPMEVISAPVAPDKPGDPPLVVALLSELDAAATAEPMAPEFGVRLPTGRQFRYFDIGAGVPPLPWLRDPP